MSQTAVEGNTNIPVPQITVAPSGTITDSVKHKKPKKKKISLLPAKSHIHPWENRSDLADMYDTPITDRESWWRCQIRVTPVPGSYDMPDFMHEMEMKPCTYRFKNEGRKRPSDLAGKGTVLLPGGYEYRDFIQHLDQRPATYRFKAGSRDAFDVLNFGLKDKAINVPPNAYGMEKYLSVDSEKQPVKNYMFRSQSKRFPTHSFRPRDGPAPGAYTVKEITPKPPAVTSSFRSKTPRFNTSHTYVRKKVPGPGSYAKAFQHPLPPTISKMGRQYGLFFTSEFQT